MKSMGQTAYDEAYRERQFSFIIKRDWAEIHIDARDAHD